MRDGHRRGIRSLAPQSGDQLLDLARCEGDVVDVPAQPQD
jgi:hypothetical protein